MLEIDGSYGEGGGQILRSAVALSAVTNQPVRINKIRANRPNPGLANQHITAIKAVGAICNAKFSGLEKGSSSIEFIPKGIKGGNFEFDVGTAGSITLVLQACILPALFAKEKCGLKLKGGTDVKWSPPIDYLRFVFSKITRRVGAEIKIELVRRGYYPVGGGEVNIEITPIKELKALNLPGHGVIEKIFGVVNVTNLPLHIGTRMRHAAMKRLIGYEIDIKEDLQTDWTRPFIQGTGIVLWSETRNIIIGADCLGEKGMPAEKVGEIAAQTLLEEIASGAAIDLHATDQILHYLAFANGSSSFTCRNLTSHAETNIWLIKQFLDRKFEITSEEKLKKITIK